MSYGVIVTLSTEEEKVRLMTVAHNDPYVYAKADHARNVAVGFNREMNAIAQHVSTVNKVRREMEEVCESKMLAHFMLLLADFNIERNEEIAKLKAEVVRLKMLVVEPMVLPKR